MSTDAALQRVWRRRLKEDGFDDIELPDGTLRGPTKPPGRWRSFEAASPLEREATSDYFVRATTFCATYAFGRLPPKVRSVWRLHAKGQSNSEVAKTLGFSLKTVRNSLRTARVCAGLPEVTSSIGHGR
jgi:DNA-directed RNA polymerase specialized sigma24 family protein